MKVVSVKEKQVLEATGEGDVLNVAVLDFGVKANILTCLHGQKLQTYRVPVRHIRPRTILRGNAGWDIPDETALETLKRQQKLWKK